MGKKVMASSTGASGSAKLTQRSEKIDEADTETIVPPSASEVEDSIQEPEEKKNLLSSSDSDEPILGAPGQEIAAPGPENAAPGQEIAAPHPEIAAPGPDIAHPGHEDAAPDQEDAAPAQEDPVPEQEENVRMTRRELQIRQLGTDKTMFEHYANIEKDRYGSCMLDQNEEYKNAFQLMYYLGDENAEIGYNHSVFDLYNLLAIENFEGYGLDINMLTCMTRKIVVLRARTLQYIQKDKNSVKDYHIYDHLLENWSDLMTVDILLLHNFHKEKNFRTLETRVLSWIASRMYNKPKIY